MQIIIPMTGYGSRFKKAGYSKLKPFIQIDNKSMIDWVVKMFPGDEDKIAFICQQGHLNSLDYIRSELNQIAPNATIFSISNWVKKGPVNDVLQISDYIDNSSQVIICYCDYYMHWDYTAFKKNVLNRNCDGAIPCYSGFHPHLIPEKNLYASCKVDKNEDLIDIKEKFSWEKDKTKALHSPGVYYFKTGEVLKKYCQKMIDADDNISGEYYASLPFNYMVKDNLKIWCPINVSYFCQWGTPEDLEDYIFWMNIIRKFKQ
ncbi:glycosyltransferase family 2 protein [Candidatus Marinamargulisbacteria bacterium]|jgi:NDP-sugar pyrophosphorylase family protein|nr:glycosyltransferase family 2 protein [Candidatus Marinamargulisbacteria bacterium]